MITPRRVTLHRVADLGAFRSTLTHWIRHLPASAARHTFVLVPTTAAGEQLRRTVEDAPIEGTPLEGAARAFLWPMMGPRHELYQELASRTPEAPRLLAACEREVLLAAVARQVSDAGLHPPFALRPGLIAEMLSLYDHVRRLGRTIDDFDRNFRTELEKDQDSDRGAARLLQQTLFLSAVYRAYESRLAACGGSDEHTLRAALMATTPLRPLQRALITVGDRLTDGDGVWPADLDLLARLPALTQVDLLETESLLTAGLLERLLAAFPDLEEAHPTTSRTTAPTLMVPPATTSAEPDALASTHRDREEELVEVARRLKAARRTGVAAPLHRTALVVRRPLPYLYLAHHVFADAGIDVEAFDTLPLAAEPYAAALDLVLDCVSSDFTRGALLALLHSPHFTLGEGASFASLRACDSSLAAARYLGGLDRLRRLVDGWAVPAVPTSRDERRQHLARPLIVALLTTVDALAPLASRRPMFAQLDTLIGWLQRFDRTPPPERSSDSRSARVRAAVMAALHTLRQAYALHDPGAEGDVETLTAAVRRWLGSQTLAPVRGASGLQLVDAQAARYGAFDDVQILGLVDGEWPQSVRRNVLYPSSLLALLEPQPARTDPGQRDRAALQSARAAFKDLVLSPTSRLRLSLFALENDAVVEPSILIDDVPSLSLATVRESVPACRVTLSEALALEPRRSDVLTEHMAAWAQVRLAEDRRETGSRRGQAGAWLLPRVSVSKLELYLNCPFKFFASHVLRLEEPPEDESTLTPLERGRFLHELWERFFAEWQRRGHGRIEARQLSEARTLFAAMCEEALAALSPSEAALERHRLLGSALSPGIAYRVFAMEAKGSDRIAERLLEYPLQGDFTFRTSGGRDRAVTLNAKTDRIDVLEGGRLRVIDYKSKTTPDPKTALQLPIYALVARDSLRRSRGGEWTLAEALYFSFEGQRPVVMLKPGKDRTLDDLLVEAQHRMFDALDGIAAGSFPPSPAKSSLCRPCSFRTVCRLEVVDLAAETATLPSADDEPPDSRESGARP